LLDGTRPVLAGLGIGLVCGILGGHPKPAIDGQLKAGHHT
jgi:hypothetical protein